MHKQHNSTRILRALMLALAFVALDAVAVLSQTVSVRGSIGKAVSAADSTKVTIYGLPSANLDNVLFENINICISIPDQGLDNPMVFISQNHVPSLDWVPIAGNPEVHEGRAYYTFIGNDNESGVRISWSAANDNPILQLSFKEGIGRSFVQLNDLTDAGGIGSGGGNSAQSFWYVQVNTLGDLTDYAFKFYQSAYSKMPVNGGIAAPSAVETTEQVALPVVPSPENTEWLLFPNPTSGPLRLISGVSEMTWLRIYNQMGHLIWEQETLLQQAEPALIDFGPLPIGAYLFEVQASDGRRLFVDRFVMLPN